MSKCAGGKLFLSGSVLSIMVNSFTDATISFADSLKKNPLMGEDELEQVAPGLGSEAAQQGLGGVSDKYGRL